MPDARRGESRTKPATAAATRPTRSLFALSLVLFLAAMLPSARARCAAIGEPAPAFVLPASASDTVSLEGLRGRVVYVDFWASWCAPCRRSFPWMNDLHRRYGARGLAIVAINVDRIRADAERFLRQTPAEFTVAFDPAGTSPSAYGVKGMPSSFLIDPRGTVTLVETGFRDDRKAEIEERIRGLLAGR